jgi:hypothetical protein
MGRKKVLPDMNETRSTAPKETRRTSGNRNSGRYVDEDTGEIQTASDAVQSYEYYKTWMRVKGTKKAFLAAYSECGNLSIACNVVGIHPMTVHGWLRTDDVFREDFEVAVEYAVSILEMEARRRALDGSDRLLEFLLKSLKPEVYRERYEIKQELTADYVIDISPAQATASKDVTPPGADSSPALILGE